MFNVDAVVRALLSTGQGSAGRAAFGLLTGRNPSRIVAEMVQAGAVAALGSVAMGAWHNYQAGRSPAAPPVRDDFGPPPDEDEREALGKALVLAMVGAAKADGTVDDDEKRRILARLDAGTLSLAERTFVQQAIDAPIDLDTIASAATTPARAAEIYAAALVAITVDTAAEQAFLAALAHRLALDPALVAQIHRIAGVASPS